ncbi:hypothetical protein RB195_026251 [Necator americanus]|uniref:SUN domain-containing protein n=1 Tax=Necator americanus TaxID=51031 RepID=A0ABR1EW43_NECAM
MDQYPREFDSNRTCNELLHSRKAKLNVRISLNPGGVQSCRKRQNRRLRQYEADLLTSPFLNYSTGYTYAFSQSYNPDKPPAWEVPNINNNLLHITNQENVDYAAPSIMRSLGQAGYNAFRTFFNVVLWVLYTITVRPVKSVGFLLYDTVVAVVYLTRCLGESITGFLYSKIEERRRPFRRRSFFDLVIVTFFKLVYGIASVIRYPVDLICSGFRAINLALTRKYYELLAANGRRLNNQAMIERMRKMNKETAECNHWMMLRKAEQESAQRYEWNGDRFDPNDPNDPDKRFYNLRSRTITALDTDSEDDEVPRRRKTVRFDTVSNEILYDNPEYRRMSMAYRIATWLGSTASSVVYYLLYAAHFAVLCIMKPYYFLVGMSDSSYTTPSNSREEVVLVGRHPYRRMSGGADYDGFDYDLYPEAEPSPLVSRFTSFCSTVLYAPCRAFLFVAFAVVDLFRWLQSRVIRSFGWAGKNSKNIIEALYNRRRRWIWWLLPLFLLLFVLLSRRDGDSPLIILGHRVSDMQEKISDYAYNVIDSEGIYAKSLNSIYDEYWLNGKFAKYDLLTRISSAVSNAWLFIVTITKTAYDLCATIVSDVTSYVLDFLATTCHMGYSKLPSMPSFAMPTVGKPNWSTIYSVSPSQLVNYFPSGPNMSSLKSSAVGFVSNAEKFFYNLLWNIRAAGELAVSCVHQLFLMAYYIITYPFHRLYDGVPEISLWKSSTLSAGSTVEQCFYNYLAAVTDVGNMVVNNVLGWLHFLWKGVSGLILLLFYPLQRLQVAVLENSAEIKGSTRDVIIPRDETKEKTSVVHIPSPTTAIDEKKLIEKITAIVDARMDHDLKLKLETELSMLKASYEEKISSLKAEKNLMDIDYSHLESLIRAAISEYDSDKTGMFDFALESAGASIISTRCSENYNTYSRLEKIWNIPLWYSSYGPRTVIQRNSKTLFPGECWSFKGPVGYITIGLSHPINMTIFSYEHIGAHQAPGGLRPSCPRTFKIWAYKSEADMDTRVLLGDFIYDIKGTPLQFFVVKTQPDYPVKIIEMEVTSNYGAEYTSLYRVRVHGSLYKPGTD